MNPTAQLEQNGPQVIQSTAPELPCKSTVDLSGFPYGRRYIRRVKADGEITYDEVPLRWEDLLHPEAEDELVVVPGHSADVVRLYTGLKLFAPKDKTFLVVEDMNVDLGLPGVRGIRPDVGVFEVETVPDGFRKMGTVDMTQLDAKPLLFIEVTSDSTRPNDVDPKYKMYEQAKVQQYILVDQAHPSGTAQITGYQYQGSGFVEQQPDASGRLFLPAFDLWIGLEEEEAVLYDKNGLVPDVEGMAEQVEEHKQRAEDAQLQFAAEKTRADTAEERMREMEAELARLKGE